MHLIPLIQDLAVILGAAGMVSLLFQKLKQPVVLGYLLAGAFLGPNSFSHSLVSDLPNIRTWGELGVIFLMFSLGLEFRFRKIARVGKTAGVSALFEVIFMVPLGYVTGKLFAWSNLDSLFLGAMLSISSTTIIIRALGELKLKTRRFADLIFGILIVEDLIAILILVALSTVALGDGFSGMSVLQSLFKLILVVGGWFITGYLIVPRLIRFVGRSQSTEILTIVAVALCLGLVVFATHFDYSPALGAFIMGSILAETPELHRIEERIAPLRDLFAAVFFVSVGMLIDVRALVSHLDAILAISAVTIVGKIVSITLGSLVSGQDFRTSVRVGFGLAQIGEFSFIIAGLGLTLKVTSDFIYPVGVAVSLVTTFTTPYLMRASAPISEFLHQRLPKKFIHFVENYSSNRMDPDKISLQAEHFKQQVLRWMINGVAVSILIVGGAKWIAHAIPPLAAWLIAMALACPFLWGMFVAFGHQKPQKSVSKRALSFHLLTVIWVTSLSARYFESKIFIPVAGALISLLLLVSYRHLGRFYFWCENHFLSIFKTPSKPMDKLAPWDAHLVQIKVHPNALLVGKKLKDSGLRNQHGLNIVAIQRGLQAIIGPHPDEFIMPEDGLLVFGTDTQIDRLKTQIESAADSSITATDLDRYEMKPLQIPQGSPFEGKSIQSLAVRERFGTNIVGLERKGERRTHLPANFIINALDILWTVGDKPALEKFTREMMSVLK